MARTYSTPTIKQLFAEAIMCAHPTCDAPLIFSEHGHDTVVADIAHIRSASKNGPRYDETFRGELDGTENLLLLCGTHHRPIDRHETAYTVEDLLDWKAQQIAAATPGGTTITEAQAKELIDLSDEDRNALNSIARIAEQVVIAAEKATNGIADVQSSYNARRDESFRRMPPMFEVDDDGNRTRIGADKMDLSGLEQHAFRDRATSHVKQATIEIDLAVEELRKEMATMRMRDGGALDERRRAVVAAAIRLRDNLENAEYATAVRNAVSELWRAANGDLSAS